MEVASSREGGILLVILKGRFDAFGASQVEGALGGLIMEADSFAVIDMREVPYLSSGGIRSLVAAHKLLSRRGGGLHLCDVAAYPRQVLEMAGFDQLFAMHGTRGEALKACAALATVKNAESDWARLPKFRKDGTEYTVFTSPNRGAALKVAGSLSKVLRATLEPSDILLRRFSETEYSLGLGALGGSAEECFGVLGEMITIGGTMVWLPTDGNDTPDFLIPRKDTGEVMIHTGLNIALDGGFNDIIAFESDGKGHTLSDVYASVFEIAAERGKFRGLASLAMLADIKGLCSSGVKISPVKQFAPQNGETILSPENIGRWMALNTAPRHEGRTMVSFGVGLDLTADYSSLDREALDNVFYLNPANVASNRMMLHNHGVVFEHMDWKRTLELDDEIRRIVQEGTFVDMRHLLDSTQVSRGIIGASYIDEVRLETPAAA